MSPPLEALRSTISPDATLVFESRFESGNLEKAVRVNEWEYDLELSTDFNTRGHTQWFYFSISNTRKDQPYKFNIINFYKSDSLYNHGLLPVVYSEKRSTEGDGIGWYRAGENVCYYPNTTKRKDKKARRCFHRQAFTSLRFPSLDRVYIAHCYPFTFTDLRNHIDQIQSDPNKASKIRRKRMCDTEAGNICEILTLTSQVVDPEVLRSRKVIAISARVHPGETNSSWMMKGLLDFLLSGCETADNLLDTFIFKIVPMLNPDGVIIGNYRCGLGGNDLNRITKGQEHPLQNPMKFLLDLRYMRSEKEIVLFIDLHGHSRKNNIFCYGCDR
ncbi:hypothetical protein GUITHDRAFT_83271 [Guillardia theta CCMP2712]|uniref:Peptidase M14 domain-containing protein n=1 Tax=Guillardia theta (strain CCMP2712) TaxID=905079 RepID=L1I5Y5_GUITC|nr:hypothetical protein GUITHDRAFT_83271 [Guillardia theta CCMP2712]EKX31269.1 hypothetical protein GUITHDRAFT_83271 [Guillardia theta CCMP2712]|eukprot:XP_005818249.1 hypothetical protein GUITHDRAFT_83271 [Guillardia theta CCMP2712]